MNHLRPSVLCVSLVTLALLGACSKQESPTATSAVSATNTTSTVSVSKKEHALPQECIEAEEAQRACTETLAAGYERLGQPAAARTLRDALPAEMEKTRAIWMQVADRDGLARSCAATRDGIRAQPQCNKR
ncbi:MAG: hypothetical protein JO067_07650 [Cupriavidus sp.]|nr:hypothetical protein [Cupriavidus sp.]